ncbi:Ig-like domain-containing protein [Myxococcus landrumensis]|uniref:Ig-like domain-containing protein n=1 Tax=Myxococcus landrumensis TaxID=2813577 RepID=A0ABX7NC19_9BACT|nr:Ig-like domain-containing protein [Myxococcus landrumus]QSQ15157.1 Ig-like domain-containing protein [Myxococcus landrumus]
MRASGLLGLAALAVTCLSACLEPGDPIYPERDSVRPRVVSTEPGSGEVLAAGAPMRITFSEAMDVRSLRPGIAVFTGRDEVPLTLTAPEVPELDANVERGDVPYIVEAVASEGSPLLPDTQYTLVLRDVLTDFEGNPLGSEVRVVFRTAR